MDYTENTILSLLKKRPIVSRTEVHESMTHENREEIREAIQSLENQGFIVRVSPIGEESYSITKIGLKKLQQN